LGDGRSKLLPYSATASQVEGALEEMLSPQCVFMNEQGQPQLVDVPTTRKDFLVFPFEDGSPRWSNSYEVSDTSFCGRSSMFMPVSKNVRMPSGPSRPYLVADFPWVCMAYRIPPTSIVNMRLHLGYRIYEIGMNSNSFWTRIGSWNIISDDKYVQQTVPNLASNLSPSFDV
jgi:hypothetical protein